LKSAVVLPGYGIDIFNEFIQRYETVEVEFAFGEAGHSVAGIFLRQHQFSF
jgi:hypothetical protein